MCWWEIREAVILICEVRGSNSGVAEDSNLLGCYAVPTRSYRRFGGLQYLQLVELTDHEDEDIAKLRNPICMDWHESRDAWLLHEADKHDRSSSKHYCGGRFWHSSPIECDAVSAGKLSTFRQIVVFFIFASAILGLLDLDDEGITVFRNVGLPLDSESQP